MSYKKEISSSEIIRDFIKHSELFKDIFEQICGKSTENIYIFRPNIPPSEQIANKLHPKLPRYIYPSLKKIRPGAEKQHIKNIPRLLKTELSDMEMEMFDSLSGDRMKTLKKLEDLLKYFSTISYMTFRLTPLNNKSNFICNSVVFDKRYPEIISICTESKEVMREINYQLSFKRKLDDAKAKVKTATQPFIRRLSVLQSQIKEVVKYH